MWLRKLRKCPLSHTEDAAGPCSTRVLLARPDLPHSLSCASHSSPGINSFSSRNHLLAMRCPLVRQHSGLQAAYWSNIQAGGSIFSLRHSDLFSICMSLNFPWADFKVKIGMPELEHLPHWKQNHWGKLFWRSLKEGQTCCTVTEEHKREFWERGWREVLLFI